MLPPKDKGSEKGRMDPDTWVRSEGLGGPEDKERASGCEPARALGSEAGRGGR